MATDENGIHLGPDEGKVVLVPEHKIIHKLSGEGTGIDLARRVGSSLPLLLMTSLPPDHPLFVEAQTLAPVLRKPFEKDDLQALIAPLKATAP